jgi:hypothetical protein
MKSVEHLVKVAERYARKVSLAQSMEEDPKAVVADAFFGPPSDRSKDEKAFQVYILGQTSNFSQALPESIKTVDIGATVDARSKAANFLVTVTPANPAARAAVIAALVKDYTTFYGANPAARLATRVAAGTVKPDVHASATGIITVQ